MVNIASLAPGSSRNFAGVAELVFGLLGLPRSQENFVLLVQRGCFSFEASSVLERSPLAPHSQNYRFWVFLPLASAKLSLSPVAEEAEGAGRIAWLLAAFNHSLPHLQEIC